jgi:hypothetical protein
MSRGLDLALGDPGDADYDRDRDAFELAARSRVGFSQAAPVVRRSVLPLERLGACRPSWMTRILDLPRCARDRSSACRAEALRGAGGCCCLPCSRASRRPCRRDCRRRDTSSPASFRCCPSAHPSPRLKPSRAMNTARAASRHERDRCRRWPRHRRVVGARRERPTRDLVRAGSRRPARASHRDATTSRSSEERTQVAETSYETRAT